VHESLAGSLVDQFLPAGADVGRVAMISNLVDEDAKIVVSSLIGVCVIKFVDGEDGAVERGKDLGAAFFGYARIVLHALVDVVLNASQLELSINVTQKLLFRVA
jgi:hypothetical protein